MRAGGALALIIGVMGTASGCSYAQSSNDAQLAALGNVPLPPGHNQPEGIAITKDGILMISEEATRKPAAITLYRWYPSQKLESIQ